jgi:hypothetical protein
LAILISLIGAEKALENYNLIGPRAIIAMPARNFDYWF